MSTVTPARLAESAAPLDALLVDAAVGPVRRFVPDLSTAKWAVSLARKPGLTARRLAELGAEAGRVLTGTSTVAPHRGTAGSPTSPGPRTPDEAAGPAVPGRRPHRHSW